MLIKKIPKPLIFFVGGFLLDILTLGRVDDHFNIATFFIYLALSFYGLYLVMIVQQGEVTLPENKIFQLYYRYNNEVFHYCQGALLSAFTLIFFKSASISSSFLFMFLLVGLLLANEVPFLQRQKFFVKTLFAHLTLMSFCLVYVPLLIGFINYFITFSALAIYLVIINLFAELLRKKNVGHEIIHTFFRKQSLIIFAFIVLCRFINIIPPVPLSLRSAGIYHQVEKKYPEYIVSHQKPWWKFWQRGDQDFLARPGDKLYFFTQVFAPRGFKDNIYVRWQFYERGAWQTSDRIPLPITGGRELGFRGYTYKKNYSYTDGRVIVETKNGQEIGRLSFSVTKDSSSDERQFKQETL